MKTSRFFALILLLCACGRELPDNTVREVRITVSPIALRTTLSVSRDRLNWVQGDAVGISHNASGNQNVKLVYDGSPEMTIDVPATASRIYASYPYSESAYSIPHLQIQQNPGFLEGEYLPMSAEADIVEGRAALSFEPEGGIVAFNVYKSETDGNEAVRGLAFCPAQGAASRLEVTHPAVLVSRKPDDPKGFASQLYLCTDKGKYANVKITVQTTSGKLYEMYTDSTPIDLENNDVALLSINLSTKTVHYAVSGSTESFENDMDVTDVSLPGIEREQFESLPEITSPDQLDFSRVGYHWGDDQIPVYPQYGAVLTPTGADDTEMIQSAVDAFPDGAGGAIVLGPGTFRISSILNIRRSGLVLRGSTDGNGKLLTTILWTDQSPADVNSDAIHLGADQTNISMFLNWSQSTHVISSHTPVGSMFVYVEDASLFAPGDRVAIHRTCTQKWLDDIKMTLEGGLGTAWRCDDYIFDFYRYVIKVEGQKVYLDNPVVMSLDSEYGGGYLVKVVLRNFVKESGIENLIVDCLYDSSKTGSDGFGSVCCIDEDHAKSAIRISNAEHCWVKGIEARHMVFSGARFGQRTFYSEICDSRCVEPVSIVDGRRRYAFSNGGGQMCIVRNCFADRSRHAFVTTGQVCGPNVFLKGRCENNLSSTGPHCNWAMGILYDRIEVSGVDPSRCSTGDTYVSSTDKFAGQLQVQDAFTWGATMDQGWEGANHVLWNCDADIVICQNPWVTSQNWAWGCTGIRKKSSSSNTDKDGGRPQGNFNSHGTHILMDGFDSLYEWQLEQRHSSGINHFVPGFDYK